MTWLFLVSLSGFVFAAGRYVLIAYTDQEQDQLNKADQNFIFDFNYDIKFFLSYLFHPFEKVYIVGEVSEFLLLKVCWLFVAGQY